MPQRHSDQTPCECADYCRVYRLQSSQSQQCSRHGIWFAPWLLPSAHGSSRRARGCRMIDWLTHAYCWLQHNDIPNWIALPVALIFWPLAILWWQRRSVNGVRGLEVHQIPGTIAIGNNPFLAVDLQFQNHTGSVVYI